MDAKRYLIVDTNAITACMFANYCHGAKLPRLVELAQNAAARYDIVFVFVCKADIPCDNTRDRFGEMHREVFQKQIKAELLRRKITLITLSLAAAWRSGSPG